MEILPKVICGLGNEGERYHNTRHNIGFLAVDQLVSESNSSFKNHTKLQSEAADIEINNQILKVIKPNGFINQSGLKIKKICDYYKFNAAEVMVLHDDLDMSPGKCKITFGGGSGGHNGLKDIISHMTEQFWRIKIGIGRPGFGDKDQISNYVLNRPTSDENQILIDSINIILRSITLIYQKGMEPAKTFLHTETSA